MDIFYEQMIKRAKTASDKVLITAALLLSVLFTSGIIFLFFCGITLGGFNIFFIFAIWWLFVLLLKGFNVEYEYTITNHELDIDVIKGKNRRKHITTVNLKNIEYFGNVNKTSTVEAMNNSGVPAKEYYFVSSKNSKNIYATDVISKINNSKIRVYIEPNDKLKEYIRLANPKAFKDTL